MFLCQSHRLVTDPFGRKYLMGTYHVNPARIPTGSVLAGTIRSQMVALDTHVHVESDEPRERIQRLIQMVEQTCYTLQALLNPVQVSTYATLNGENLPVEQAGASGTHS